MGNRWMQRKVLILSAIVLSLSVMSSGVSVAQEGGAPNKAVMSSDFSSNAACSDSTQCVSGEYCKKLDGDCVGVGACTLMPPPATNCSQINAQVCGCNGVTYPSACAAELDGVSVSSSGVCPYVYYFPSIKDEGTWENYITVQAKESIAMCVSLKVYDLGGTLKGKYRYCDDPTADAGIIQPNARVAQKPSWIAGSLTSPVPVEGSVIVETNVPAIATTNALAFSYKGFSIYEAAKPRAVHFFPKQFDGPTNYTIYDIIQNIYDTPINVTIKLFGKTASSPGNGATKTYTIPPYGTAKIRPSDAAGGINFDGSAIVYSDLAAPGDGLGKPVPGMCRYEVLSDAIAIYESTVTQPALHFPFLKDGKFGTIYDYQNFLSVVNTSQSDAIVSLYLYNKNGTEEGKLLNEIISAGGKKTWRPAWIKGTMTTPLDFEGSMVVTSSIPVIGQTNVIYPVAGTAVINAFELFESALPSNTLFFPKAFDNLVGDGHLIDNYVYIQNPNSTAKNVSIELYNTDGSLNRLAKASIGANITFVIRPRDYANGGTGTFRGSVKVIEASNLQIAGAMRYEIHRDTSLSSVVDALTIYRSMGQ